MRQRFEADLNNRLLEEITCVMTVS